MFCLICKKDLLHWDYDNARSIHQPSPRTLEETQAMYRPKKFMEIQVETKTEEPRGKKGIAARDGKPTLF